VQTAARLGVFALGLVMTFGAALGVGHAIGPFGDGRPTGRQPGHGWHSSPTAGPVPSSDEALPGGLQVAQDGYRLSPVTTRLHAGQAVEFAFRVLAPDGAPVPRYARTHEWDLHLIVVRRDLSGFQHVHPTLGGDGVWRVPLTVGAAGQYRVFADFQPEGRNRALPAPQPVSQIDGYTVQLSGELVADTASKLTLEVKRDGQPVNDLQPYLGAYGHLVALRDGDLAYLHVHPEARPGDGRTPAGPRVTFFAEVPSAGTYRLFLDFQHAGVVRTAEFTATAGDRPAPEPPASPAEKTSPSSGSPSSGEPHGGHG
jgi:hypothetical protein